MKVNLSLTVSKNIEHTKLKHKIHKNENDQPCLLFLWDFICDDLLSGNLFWCLLSYPEMLFVCLQISVWAPVSLLWLTAVVPQS